MTPLSLAGRHAGSEEDLVGTAVGALVIALGRGACVLPSHTLLVPALLDALLRDDSGVNLARWSILAPDYLAVLARHPHAATQLANTPTSSKPPGKSVLPPPGQLARASGAAHSLRVQQLHAATGRLRAAQALREAGAPALVLRLDALLPQLTDAAAAAMAARRHDWCASAPLCATACPRIAALLDDPAARGEVEGVLSALAAVCAAPHSGAAVRALHGAGALPAMCRAVAAGLSMHRGAAAARAWALRGGAAHYDCARRRDAAAALEFLAAGTLALCTLVRALLPLRQPPPDYTANMQVGLPKFPWTVRVWYTYP